MQKITSEDVKILPAQMAFLEGFELEPGSRVRNEHVREEKKLNRLQFLVLLVGSFEPGLYSIALAREYDSDILTKRKFDIERLTKQYFNAAYGYAHRKLGGINRYHRRNPRWKLFQHTSKRGVYELTTTGKAMYDTIVKGFVDA